MKKITALLLIITSTTLVNAKDTITPEPGTLKIKEYCVNGHAFLITRASEGISTEQIYQSHGFGNPPQPKTCEQNQQPAPKKKSLFSW